MDHLFLQEPFSLQALAEHRIATIWVPSFMEQSNFRQLRTQRSIREEGAASTAAAVLPPNSYIGLPVRLS